jgi:hypothetical protein
MKMYWGVEVKLHEFLISKLDECEWSASRFHHITAGTTGQEAGWAPRASLDAVAIRKIPREMRSGTTKKAVDIRKTEQVTGLNPWFSTSDSWNGAPSVSHCTSYKKDKTNLITSSKHVYMQHKN